MKNPLRAANNPRDICYTAASIIKKSPGLWHVTTAYTEGPWKSQGIMAEVHAVDGFLVALNPFNGKPMKVFTDVSELSTWIFERTGIHA